MLCRDPHMRRITLIVLQQSPSSTAENPLPFLLAAGWTASDTFCANGIVTIFRSLCKHPETRCSQKKK